MKLKLKKGERVVTAYAETASGPGWSNTPLWVIIEDHNGYCRRACIQPKEFSIAIHTLYDISLSVHAAMKYAVFMAMNRRVKK